jgi:hypothetical protein
VESPQKNTVLPSPLDAFRIQASSSGFLRDSYLKTTKEYFGDLNKDATYAMQTNFPSLHRIAN